MCWSLAFIVMQWRRNQTVCDGNHSRYRLLRSYGQWRSTRQAQLYDWSLSYLLCIEWNFDSRWDWRCFWSRISLYTLLIHRILMIPSIISHSNRLHPWWTISKTSLSLLLYNHFFVLFLKNTKRKELESAVNLTKIFIQRHTLPMTEREKHTYTSLGIHDGLIALITIRELYTLCCIIQIQIQVKIMDFFHRRNQVMYTSMKEQIKNNNHKRYS